MRTSPRTWYALVLFGLGVAGLLYAKPGFMFREDGSMYEFGAGPDRSVFTFGTAVAALAVVSSFVFAMCDLAFPGGSAPAAVPPSRRTAFPVPGMGGAAAPDPFDLYSDSLGA